MHGGSAGSRETRAVGAKHNRAGTIARNNRSAHSRTGTPPRKAPAPQGPTAQVPPRQAPPRSTHHERRGAATVRGGTAPSMSADDGRRFGREDLRGGTNRQAAACFLELGGSVAPPRSPLEQPRPILKGNARRC